MTARIANFTTITSIECEWPQDESLDPEQNYESAYAEAVRLNPRTKLVYQGNRFPAPKGSAIYIWNVE